MAEPSLILPTRIAGKAKTQTSASGQERGASLRRDDRIDPNVSIQTLRSGRTAAAQMRSLAEVDGMASAVNASMVATAFSGWRVEAYQSWTNEFSREGLRAAEMIVSALDTLWNYTSGYQDKLTIDELAVTGILEVMLTGGCACELVLDNARIPQYIALFPYDTITWKANGRGGRYPSQKSTTGEDVDLNIPNVWAAECMKSADRVYAIPHTHSGVKQLIQYTGFIEDMQRVVRRNGQPRLLAKLDYQKVISTATPEILNDPSRLSAYLETTRAGVETLLSGLEPEDALVFYDIAEIDSVKTDGEKRDYSVLLSELSGLTASALKSNPSALGLRMGGSQNVSSTEAMLSMKLARLIQVPVETVLSRALTLAVRMYGVDSYIKFKFEPIDLRPSHELEAHKAILQNRVLELLSLGRLTDDEAQTMLGLGSIPDTAEELSGTGFYNSKAPDTVPVSKSNSRNQDITPDDMNSGGKDNEKKA